MHIGIFRHQVDVSTEFTKLSKEDEAAAEALAQSNHFRQACYFLIQAMEKSIRAKIFTLVNPNLEYFRNRNRSHSLDSAVDFLVEIISTEKVIQEQVSNQLNTYVLGKTKYNHLHNNLRYPAYFDKYDAYSMLDISFKDYENLKKRLQSLRLFLVDLHRF